VPKFQVGAGFFAEFDTIPLATASGEILVIDEHLIKFKTVAGQGRPAGFENYIGTFDYNDLGQPVGTVDTYRFVTESDQLVYKIADANIDTVELRKAAAASGDDPQALLKLIFRSNDRLTGQLLDDQMRAFAGNDVLKGKAGDDWLGGMSGSDVVRGNIGDDVLRGGGGRDTLRGGTGDDRLDGGKGRNQLTGGEGEDTFVFKIPGKPDRITVFGKADMIALGFSGLGPAGPLDPSAFHRGATANKPGQTILYDEDTGWLLYARKGSGTADPIAFAKVGKHLDHLGADDFIVI
jgi:Ca2+-binding RTX toxin-like protein